MQNNATNTRTVKEVSPTDKEYYFEGVVVDQSGNVKSYQTAEGYASPDGTTVDYFYYVKDWQGTNRSVLDATGTAVNAYDHYPYGLRMPNRHFVTDGEGNRYQFTGHQYDEETSFGYHGARYYNRVLARYMSVDPLAEQFFNWSTYNYTMDNPINLIDPTGMAPEDIGLYTVDKDGNIKHIKTVESEDEYDMLYRADDWDSKEYYGERLRVDDQEVLSQLSKPAISYAKNQAEGDIKELHKTFMFLAENTDVEWNVSKFNLNGSSKSVLGTFGVYNGTNRAPTIHYMFPNSNIQDTDIEYTLHNHPNSNAHGTERSSMGQFGNGEISGDLYYTKERAKRNGGRDVYPTYVYFSNTRNLYNVTSKGPKYIRKVNTHTDFLYKK